MTGRLKTLSIALSLSLLFLTPYLTILSQCIDRGWWDIDKDGRVDCNDRAIIYYSELRKAGYDCTVWYGYNPKQGRAHAWLNIKVPGWGWKQVDPYFKDGHLWWELRDDFYTRHYECPERFWRPYVY